MEILSKKNRMVRTQIQLMKNQVDGLRRISAGKGRSMASLIRDAVDGILQGTGTIDHEERKRRALAAAGIGRSGLVDIAENHDLHLEDAFDPERR